MSTHEKLKATGNLIKKAPHIEERKEEVLLKVDEDEIAPQVWKSCCFQVSPRMITYGGQVLITCSIIVLSSVMLIRADGSCDKSSAYIGLLSFILGKFLSVIPS